MAEERALKRQRSLADDSKIQRQLPQLSPEQQLLLEKKRRQALERRLQRQATPSQDRGPPGVPAVDAAGPVTPTLTEEQLTRIRLKREAALARKRAALENAPCHEVRLPEARPASEEVPQQEACCVEPPKLEEIQSLTQDTKVDGEANMEEPSQCLSQDEKPEEGSLLQDAVSDDEDAVSSSSAASESSMDPSEPSEGDMSSSYSSDFSTSSSSSSECSEEEPEEEEDEEEDEEAQGEAKRGEEGEDGEIEEQEDELADECTQEMAGTLSKTLGEARPRSEVPCCTDRWPVVVLEQLLSGGGEIPAPRTDRDRNAKQKLVAKLLCRWWYVLPDWPPKDFDYNAALAAQGYRKVPVEAFELEPDEDDQGLRKAFPVSGGFKGLYRNQQGSLIDVRPVTGRPSYDQLMLRATSELHRLVVLAYTRQLEDLDSKPHLPAAELEMRQQLRQELTKAQQGAKFSSLFRPAASSAA